MDADLRIEFLQRPWGRMAYATDGAGPPVMLLHAAGRSLDDWLAYRGWLRGRRWIALDFRGHGASDLPTAYFKFHRLAEDALALVDHLWVAPVDVVGQSLGGLVALEMLRLAPERVRRIALLEAWLRAGYADVLGDSFAGLSDEVRRTLTRRIRQTYVRWVPVVREDFMAEMRDTDVEAILHGTSHPVLAVYGDRGGVHPGAEALGIPKRESVRMEWVDGGSHWFSQFQVEETGRILRRFLIGEDPPDEPLPPLSLQGLMLQPK